MCIYIHIYVVYTYVILCILCVYSTDYPFFCETWAIHRKPKHLANGQPLFTNKDVATLDIAM